MKKFKLFLVLCITVITFNIIISNYTSKTVANKAAATNNSMTMTTCVTGIPCSYTDEVDVRVIVITLKRAQSLSLLLRSLDTLVLDGDRAALEIWIDRNKHNDVHHKTLEVATEFIWKGGPTRVHVQTKSAGIIGQWIDTWRPRDDSDVELGLILEDDLSVSPYAYRWLVAVFRAYSHRSDFAGATLQSQFRTLSTKPKGPMAGPKTDTVFMYKTLGTWGSAPKPLHWRRFQDWYHQHKPSVLPHFHPYVPSALPTIWYKTFERSGRQNTMWEMWWVYYIHIEKLYGVYNNLRIYTRRNDSCLCIHRHEPGLHHSARGSKDLSCLLTVWKNEYVVFPRNTLRLHWDGTSMSNRSY